MSDRPTNGNNDRRDVGGRPSKYREEYAQQARMFVERGATDRELAELFGVHRATVYRWKHEHVEFCDAVNTRARETVDARVERAFYERCVGYEYESERVFCRDGLVTRVPVTEHVPPDPSACLKSRRSDEWREKKTGADVDARSCVMLVPMIPLDEWEEQAVASQAALKASMRD